jgi:hypothetical protein
LALALALALACTAFTTVLKKIWIVDSGICV